MLQFKHFVILLALALAIVKLCNATANCQQFNLELFVNPRTISSSLSVPRSTPAVSLSASYHVAPQDYGGFVMGQNSSDASTTLVTSYPFLSATSMNAGPTSILEPARELTPAQAQFRREQAARHEEQIERQDSIMRMAYAQHGNGNPTPNSQQAEPVSSEDVIMTGADEGATSSESGPLTPTQPETRKRKRKAKASNFTQPDTRPQSGPSGSIDGRGRVNSQDFEEWERQDAIEAAKAKKLIDNAIKAELEAAAKNTRKSASMTNQEQRDLQIAAYNSHSENHAPASEPVSSSRLRGLLAPGVARGGYDHELYEAMEREELLNNTASTASPPDLQAPLSRPQSPLAPRHLPETRHAVPEPPPSSMRPPIKIKFHVNNPPRIPSNNVSVYSRPYTVDENGQTNLTRAGWTYWATTRRKGQNSFSYNRWFPRTGPTGGPSDWACNKCGQKNKTHDQFYVDENDQRISDPIGPNDCANCMRTHVRNGYDRYMPTPPWAHLEVIDPQAGIHVDKKKKKPQREAKKDIKEDEESKK